jgi:hypothetical protein
MELDGADSVRGKMFLAVNRGDDGAYCALRQREIVDSKVPF